MFIYDDCISLNCERRSAACDVNKHYTNCHCVYSIGLSVVQDIIIHCILLNLYVFLWCVVIGRATLVELSAQKYFGVCFLWLPYGIGQAIIFLPCGFYLSSSFFPRLSSVVASWMSTILLHNGVALVRI